MTGWTASASAADYIIITHDPTARGLACGPCRADEHRPPRKPAKDATWKITADGKTWRCCIDCAAREASDRGIPFPPITTKTTP